MASIRHLVKSIYSESRNHRVVVEMNEDWAEFEVTIDGNRKNTYFTADKKDALETARLMISKFN